MEMMDIDEVISFLNDLEPKSFETTFHSKRIDKGKRVVWKYAKLTSKRTLLDVSVGHEIVDSIKPDAVVGMNRMSLNAVKISEMNGDEFKMMITKGEMVE
jgi:hypothetical protein